MGCHCLLQNSSLSPPEPPSPETVPASLAAARDPLLPEPLVPLPSPSLLGETSGSSTAVQQQLQPASVPLRVSRALGRLCPQELGLQSSPHDQNW